MYSSSLQLQQQPDYPAALASLQHMDIDSLKEILNDEDKFDNFIRELPQVKKLYEEKEMLMASNKSLAEYNLSQEPVVREEKEKLLGKFQEATRLAEEVKRLKADLDSKSGKMNPDSLLILLEAANQEAEEESELMVDMYLANGGSLEEFLDQYKEKRKLAHLRRIKIDKMRELLAAKKNGTTPARPAPPPPRPGAKTSVPNYNAYSPAGNPGAYNQLPYPTAAAAAPGYPTTSSPGYPPLPGYPAVPNYPAAPGYGLPPYR